jgi:hypothetical protein
VKTEDKAPADTGSEEGNIIPVTFRRLALANADSIGNGLVQKAREGNYNATHLLLELGGIGSSGNGKTDAGAASSAPRMFLLDLVDKVMSRNRAGELHRAPDNQTQADR